jgi:hypothetical protein
MLRPDRLPELTESELRLLPLLATPLSFAEMGRLLDVPRDEILSEAVVIYSKLGLSQPKGDYPELNQ